MADNANDNHWIFCNESPEWKSVKAWRNYVRQHANKEHKDLVDKLSVEALYYVGWQVRRARNTSSKEGEYKRFLRAVGGAGDSDWYNTKAEIEYAAELEDLHLRFIPAFASGDLGDLKERFDEFVAGYRRVYAHMTGKHPD